MRRVRRIERLLKQSRMTNVLLTMLHLTTAAGMVVAVPDGFHVDLVYSAPLADQGSWVAQTPDAEEDATP